MIVQKGSIKPIVGLEPLEVVNAATIQGERVWLGTAHGLVAIDGERATKRIPAPTVRAVLAIDKDRLLVGTEEGPAMLEGDKLTFLAEKEKGKKSLSSPMHATWSLARTPDGTMFIGTMAGLYFGTKTFERAAVANDQLKDDWVTALTVVGKDVYAGTYAGGVSKLTLDTNGKLSAVHLGGGYINPDGLVVRDDQLYAATMDGLQTRPLANDRAKWTARPELATGKDVTAARLVGGELWVASRRGIAISR